MTGSRDWQWLVCRLWGSEAISADLDSGRAVTLDHPYTTRLCQEPKKRQGWPRIVRTHTYSHDLKRQSKPHSLRMTSSGAIKYGQQTIVVRFA
jgi:hypothetical protein